VGEKQLLFNGYKDNTIRAISTNKISSALANVSTELPFRDQ
jgi:hypothetical protein